MQKVQQVVLVLLGQEELLEGLVLLDQLDRKGAAGAAGAKGATGPVGPTGPQGVTGSVDYSKAIVVTRGVDFDPNTAGGYKA